MNESGAVITKDMLREWGACAEGYRRFLELFPNGATLEVAVNRLAAEGHDDWGWWLFTECRRRNLCNEYTARGYGNSGDGNSGDRNSGYGNSGDRNSGNGNSGYRNSGYGNSGGWNSGDRNSGCWNSGNRNSGDGNSGGGNSGDRNSGCWNSGNRNSGYENSGGGNSGDRNSGDWNSGDWNSGDRNSGSFNIDTPATIRVFGKDCARTVWEAAYKPDFLFFSTTEWIALDSMTEEETRENPLHTITGGILRTYDYKTAFQRSWEQADPTDRMKVKDLPNFDAEIFYQISGIDLRKTDGGTL